MEILEHGPLSGIRLSGITKFTLSGFKTLILDLSEERKTCDGTLSKPEPTTSMLIATNDDKEASELAALLTSIIGR